MMTLNIEDQFAYISLTFTPNRNKKTLLTSQQEQEQDEKKNKNNRQQVMNRKKKNFSIHVLVKINENLITKEQK